MSTITYAAWALAAGALIPLMAILNAGLARAAVGTIQATILLFATGLTASLLLAALTTAPIPSVQSLARAAPASYAGGLIVAFYILSITFLSPRFGVGNAILALAGAAPRPVTMMRAVGLLIMVIGVVIAQAGDRLWAGMR